MSGTGGAVQKRQTQGMRVAAVFCGFGLASLVVMSVAATDSLNWWAVAGAAAGFGFAHRVSVDLPGRLNVVLDFQETAVVCAALLLPTGEVLVAAVIGNLAGALRARPVPVTVVAASAAMVGTVPAVAAIAAIASPSPGPSWLAAALAGVIVQSVGSWSGVTVIVGLALGRPVSPSPFRDLALGFPMAVPLTGLGVVVAVATTVGAWTWAAVAVLVVGLYSGAQLMRRAVQQARRALTLVHLRALLNSTSTAEDLAQLSGPLLGSVLDGYDVTVEIDGRTREEVVAAVDVTETIRLLVRTVAHPPPLNRAERTFLNDAAAMLRDELAERDDREQLERDAATDALTGLPNRRALATFGAEQRRFGVVLLDVNNLKALNDIVGHVAGDELLCEVAARLQTTVRANDVVARLAGDEFVVVTTDPEGLASLLERIETALAQLPAPAECCVGVSAGAASTGPDGTTFDDVLAAADARMYAQKQHAARPHGYTRNG